MSQQEFEGVPVVPTTSENTNNTQRFLPGLPATVQMVVCAGIAGWDYINHGDLVRFTLLLAIGQMNLSQLMHLLRKIIK